MSKRNKDKGRLPPFVPLLKETLESPAWRQLSHGAKALYVSLKPSDPAVVSFGCTVALARDNGHRQTYRIVGEDEADPARGTLSYASPVARALMGKQVGDTVPMGSSGAEILSIKCS